MTNFMSKVGEWLQNLGHIKNAVGDYALLKLQENPMLKTSL